MNKIHCGDNLDFMDSLESESIDLIYIDPPFFCQKDFYNKEGIGFSDKWESRDHYLNFMRARLDRCHSLLKETGSIAVHCDQRISHHLRLMLDIVFREKNFINEVIWSYNRFSREGIGFPSMSDTILIYSRSGNFCFNKIEAKPKDNRRYSKGYHTVVDSGERKLLVYDEKKAFSKIREYKNKRHKIAYTKAVAPLMGNVWHDISIINPMSKERAGYETQKPLALLERIIKAFTNKGDTVADFFCGSGTTLVAAKKLGRNYIGCDLNKDAIEITKRRLEE